jgi:hypothetical protein
MRKEDRLKKEQAGLEQVDCVIRSVDVASRRFIAEADGKRFYGYLDRLKNSFPAAHPCLVQPLDRVRVWVEPGSLKVIRATLLDEIQAAEPIPPIEVSKIISVGRWIFAARECGCSIMLRDDPELPDLKVGDRISHGREVSRDGRIWAVGIRVIEEEEPE